MIHHERTLDIDANPDNIWAMLSRFMQIDEIAPQVVHVEALTHGANGVGSRRRCYFENGTSLVEEVAKWTPGRGYTVQLSEMSAMPITKAHAAIAIEVLTENRVRVTWSMDYRMKYGLLGWLIGQTLMKVMIGRILDGNLKALSEKMRSVRFPDGQLAYY
ncbi:SRPBCC family protein [uncultured Ruegeria sp.]|uniref:SRPBCC family protein n=1 Tax=uncultured Ruegeria sp. TaxID=259304 RepID=UPI00262C5923|nr:SRPBCC family protein [uncultured Ruegeria sp.]